LICSYLLRARATNSDSVMGGGRFWVSSKLNFFSLFCKTEIHPGVLALLLFHKNLSYATRYKTIFERYVTYFALSISVVARADA